MTGKSVETEIAVLRNDVEHLDKSVEELIKVVKENNEIISRSKGVIFGASLVVSAIWGVGVVAWKLLK